MSLILDPNYRAAARFAALTIIGLQICFAGPRISVQETGDSISIVQDGKTMLSYSKAVRKGPEGMDPIYDRSGYIHPVFTPDGRVVTGDFSEDHPHQRGIFMAGTKTVFRGANVDFWNLHKRLGRTEHARTLSKGVGRNSASFTVELNHVAVIDGRETVALKEIWTVVGRAEGSDFFLFDIQSEQFLATDSPLTFPEYHYGGMALRGSNLWTPLESNPDGTCYFLTSNGHGRVKGNHTRVRWVTMSGIIDDRPASITVFCHPDNFRFPQAARLHPKMPYFTFAPMYDGGFSIARDEIYRSRYRYIATSSEPDADWIESRWADYTREGSLKPDS